MFIQRIRRIFVDFLNGTTGTTIHATEYTDNLVFIQAMVGGEKFPRKFAFDMECVNKDVLRMEDKTHWVVVENVKKRGEERTFDNYYIRFIGTPVQCAVFIEKHETFKPSPNEVGGWAAEFGGVAKVFKPKAAKKPTANSDSGTIDDGEEEDFSAEIPS
jgi:hypothetical protein